MIIEKSKIKILLECYEGTLRVLFEKGTEDEDRDTAYTRYCGAVWAFRDIGALTTEDAFTWINRFAYAVDGAEYPESVTA